MKAVTDALGIARSNVAARLRGQHPRRGPQNRDGDAELSADIHRFVDARPTYRFRRIAALINRKRRSGGLSEVNRKRICRLMTDTGPSPGASHQPGQPREYKGKGQTPQSDLRWCSDDLEFTWWSGTTGGISGELTRDT